MSLVVLTFQFSFIALWIHTFVKKMSGTCPSEQMHTFVSWSLFSCLQKLKFSWILGELRMINIEFVKTTKFQWVGPWLEKIILLWPCYAQIKLLWPELKIINILTIEHSILTMVSRRMLGWTWFSDDASNKTALYQLFHKIKIF